MLSGEVASLVGLSYSIEMQAIEVLDKIKIKVIFISLALNPL